MCLGCLQLFCIKSKSNKNTQKAIHETEDGSLTFNEPIKISEELREEPTAMTLGGLTSTSIFKKISEWSLPEKKSPKNLFNMSEQEMSFFEDDHLIDEFINN